MKATASLYCELTVARRQRLEQAQQEAAHKRALGLPIPPSIAAANPLSASITPTS